MADDQTVAIWYTKAGHGVTILRGHGGSLERPEMEEHAHLGRSDKLADELAENNRRCLTRSIEKNAESFDPAQTLATVARTKLELLVVTHSHEMAGREAVFGLGVPL